MWPCAPQLFDGGFVFVFVDILQLVPTTTLVYTVGRPGAHQVLRSFVHFYHDANRYPPTKQVVTAASSDPRTGLSAVILALYILESSPHCRLEHTVYPRRPVPFTPGTRATFPVY